MITQTIENSSLSVAQNQNEDRPIFLFQEVMGEIVEFWKKLQLNKSSWGHMNVHQGNGQIMLGRHIWHYMKTIVYQSVE